MESSIIIPDKYYFRSSRSAVMFILIWGTLGIVFYFMFSDLIIALFRNEELKRESILVYIFLVPFWISIFYLFGNVWFFTGYTIGENKHLYVNCGPIKFSPIEIEKIGIIERSYSFIPISLPQNPALSIKKLKLRYWGGVMMISPKDEEGFIKLIKKLNPSIVLEL